MHRSMVLFGRFGRYYKLATAHCIFREVSKCYSVQIYEGGGGSLQTVAREILSPAPLNRLFHSLLAFSVLNKLKTCQIFAPFFDSLHAVPVSFMVPKFSLKFATQSNKFEIMANYTSTANVVLSVNGKQAQQMLSTLQREAQNLEKKIAKAATAGDKATMRKLQRELSNTNRMITQLQGSAASADQVLRRLDKASPKELNKTLKTLQSQLNGIQRGTAAWDAHVAKIKAVKTELQKVNATLATQQSRWDRMNMWLNNAQTFIMGLAAAITGLVMAGRKAVNAFAEMEEELANTRKYTGLTEQKVLELNEAFKKMDTRTPREKLNELAQEAGRLGKNMLESVQGYVEAADIINVALVDLGDGATQTIAKLTNIFGVEELLGTKDAMLAVGSTVNVLSQNCTASKPYLVEFAQRMAGIGSQAGLTIPQILAFGAVLDANGQKVEMSATAIQKVIMNLANKNHEFAATLGMDAEKLNQTLKHSAKDGLLMFLEALQNMGKEVGFENATMILAPAFKEMGLDAARVSQVLSTLAMHLDEVKWQMGEADKAFREATSATKEYEIFNNTAQAAIDKAKKRVSELAIELGEKLYPIMKHIYTTSGIFLRVLNTIVSFLIEYRRVIVPLVAAIADAGGVGDVNIPNGGGAGGGGSNSAADRFAAEQQWREREEASARIAYATGKKDYLAYTAEMDRIAVEFYERQLLHTDLSEDERLQITAKWREAQMKQQQHADAALLSQSVDAENDRYNAQMAEVKQFYIDGQISKETYDQRIEEYEILHQRNLSQLYKEGSKERLQAEQQLQSLLIAQMQRRQRETEEHERKLASMKKEFFGDNPQERQAKYDADLALLQTVYDREIAAAGDNADEKLRIEEAFQQAKLALQKRYGLLAEEDERNRMQRAIADSVEWLNGDGGKAMQGAISTLTSGMGAIFSSLSSLIQAELEIETVAIEKRYDKEISAAEGNSYKVKKLEAQKEKEIAKAKNEANRKMFAMQVIQAVAQTAQNAISAYGSAAAIPVIGYILAPIAAGMAVAAGMIQIAAIKKQQQASEAQGYSAGGFTPDGRSDEPVGIVHAGEWVASQKLVKSPKTRPIIEALEYAQRTNTIGSLAAADVSRSITAPMLLASQPQQSVQPNVIVNVPAQTSPNTKIEQTLDRLNERLNEPFVTVATVTGDKGINKAQDDYERLLRNKSPKTRK